MSIQTLSTRPQASDFTALDEHEAATPQTFFGGKPVLHCHVEGCDVLFSDSANAQEDFQKILSQRSGDIDDGSGQEFLLNAIDVFVTSESLTLSLQNASRDDVAISIPYPAISLHATQSLRKSTSPLHYSHDPQLPNSNGTNEHAADAASHTKTVSAVYLQIDPLFSTRRNMNPDEDDGDEESIEIQIIPPEMSQEDAGQDGVQPAANGHRASNAAAAKGIFEALSRCADLHPDPDIEDEDAGGAGIGAFGGMPGDGGWITTENMHEFEFADVEENGDAADNDEAQLGPGAGTRRVREDGGGDDVSDGHEEDLEETKWQRTG